MHRLVFRKKYEVMSVDLQNVKTMWAHDWAQTHDHSNDHNSNFCLKK